MEFRVTYKTHSLLSFQTQHMLSNVQHYEYNESVVCGSLRLASTETAAIDIERDGIRLECCHN